MNISDHRPEYGDSYQCHQKWPVAILSKLLFEIYLIWKYERKGEYLPVYIFMFMYLLSYVAFSVISDAICRSSLCKIICRNPFDAGSKSVKLAQHRTVSCAYDLSCYCYSWFVLLNQESNNFLSRSIQPRQRYSTGFTYGRTEFQVKLTASLQHCGGTKLWFSVSILHRSLVLCECGIALYI